MIENINKNISVWRGNNTPPTDYHLWIKDDGSQFLNINNKWILQSNDSNKDIINVSKLFNNYNISLDLILLLLSNYDNIPIHQGIILRFKETNLWKEYILIDNNYKLKTNWKLISVSNLLDDSEKINSNYLPSYVDDVLEFNSFALFPTKGESGKIYIDTQLNRCYRWNGFAYILIATVDTATESQNGLMSGTDKIQLNLIHQETLFHPIININQICPNQGQGDNKDRWLITYAIEAAWNWIKANPNRNSYLSPGLSIMFRSTNVRATNGFDGPFLVFTYTSTNFSENEFKTDSNWCRTLSEADLNYELADSLYDGFLSKTDWTRFNNATSTINSHVINFQNPHQTNKSQIGLSNVTNDALVKRSEMGANNGVATLDSSGKVVTSLLPSFVDDVLEFESKTAFPVTGESGKIYVSLDTNLTYRWGGTEYVEISKSLALGETSSTAYAGNKGKDTTDKLNTHLKNYNNPHQVTKSQVGLGNVDNTSDLNKPVSTATQTELNKKVDKIEGKGLSTEDYTTADKTKLAGIASGAQVNSITGVKGGAEESYRIGNVNITAANLGLGNVNNTSDANKPISTATQTALNNKVDKVIGKGLSSEDYTSAEKTKLSGIEAGALVNTITGIKGSSESSYRTGNVSISPANIGLGNVNNTSDINKPISTATQSALDGKVDKVSGKGLSSEDYTKAEKDKLAGIEAGALVNTVTGIKGNAETNYRIGNINITPTNIGLGNVDNTSDLEKPVSNAVQAALDTKISELYLGYNRYPIDNSDYYKVILFNLEYFEANNLLCITDPNREIFAHCNLPLATTENDGLFSRYDKSKLNGIESGALVNTITGIKGGNESNYRIGNVNITKDNIGLGNVDNTSDLNKPISTATQTALDKKANKATTLAGYGITDAKINNNGTITLGTVSIEVMTNDEINAMFV